jgi:hypothetical protein
MAWSAPSSVTTGDLITAATWNQDVVDNVQYVHDNRLIYIAMGGYTPVSPSNSPATSYTELKLRCRYLGSEIDETDLDGAFFWFNAWLSTADTFGRLYDATNTQAITSSEVTSSDASEGQGMTSADFKADANFPTADATLYVQGKRGTGSGNFSYREAALILAI